MSDGLIMEDFYIKVSVFGIQRRLINFKLNEIILMYEFIRCF